MNFELVKGIIEGSGHSGSAHLQPEPGFCCVESGCRRLNLGGHQCPRCTTSSKGRRFRVLMGVKGPRQACRPRSVEQKRSSGNPRILLANTWSATEAWPVTIPRSAAAIIIEMVLCPRSN